MGRKGRHRINVKLLAVVSVMMLSSSAWAQNFNDVPGRDDEKYLALIFPKKMEKDDVKIVDEISAEVIAQQTLVNYATQFIGLKYRPGGTTEHGFDCSGYMMAIFKQIGVSLPHSSAQIAQIGAIIDYSEAKVGDLLFFTGSNKHSGKVGHVGMVCEVLPNGEGLKMIHATVHGGIMIDNPLVSAYFKPRYLFARRVLN